MESGRFGYNSTLGYYTPAASSWRLVERVFRLGQLTPNGGQLGQNRPVSIGLGRPSWLGAWLGHKWSDIDEYLPSPGQEGQRTRCPFRSTAKPPDKVREKTYEGVLRGSGVSDEALCSL